MQALEYIAQSLTSVFFAKEKVLLFDEVVAIIVEELYRYSSGAYYYTHVGNTVRNCVGERYIHVTTGSITIQGEIIDVTELCLKHFDTYRYMTGDNAILFD